MTEKQHIVNDVEYDVQDMKRAERLVELQEKQEHNHEHLCLLTLLARC